MQLSQFHDLLHYLNVVPATTLPQVVIINDKVLTLCQQVQEVKLLSHLL